MATHSSVLAWRIPGIGEPGGLPSMGSHRVGHDWSDLAATAGNETVCHWVKTKQNEEKKILWVNDFPCIPYNFFLLKLLPAPLSARQSFSLLTRNVPKPGEFPIKFSPGLHLTWKLQECLSLMWMVNGHENLPLTYTKGVKNTHFPLIWTWFSLVVRFYFQLWSFKSSVPFSAALNASGSSPSSCPCASHPQ